MMRTFRYIPAHVGGKRVTLRVEYPHVSTQNVAISLPNEEMPRGHHIVVDAAALFHALDTLRNAPPKERKS